MMLAVAARCAAMVSLWCAACAPKHDVATAQPSPVVAVGAASVVAPAPAADPAALPVEPWSDASPQAILAALEGVCERASAEVDGALTVGCKSCPDANASRPSPEVARQAPELAVTKLFEARLTGKPSAVLSYTGCHPGIFQYAGTLLVDRAAKNIVRDEPGLSFLACRLLPRPGEDREVLVCVSSFEHQKMSAGTTDYHVGVYDPLTLRATSSDDPADIAAWHAMPLFTSDAAFACIAGGPPPGEAVRWGNITGLSVDPATARVTVHARFAKAQPNAAFRTACETDGDLAQPLGAQAVALQLTTQGTKLVPSAATRAWLAQSR